MLLGSVLGTWAMRPLGASSDPTHSSSAAGASLWCTRQRSTRSSSGEQGPCPETPGRGEMRAYPPRLGAPHCPDLWLMPRPWAGEIGQCVLHSARPLAASRTVPHPVGTSAVRHRWSSGSGSLPSSLCRYHVQGAGVGSQGGIIVVNGTLASSLFRPPIASRGL